MPSLLQKPFIQRFDEDALILLVDDLADTCINETIRDYLKALKLYLQRSGGIAHPSFDRLLRDLARNTPLRPRRAFAVSSTQIADRAAACMADALDALHWNVERTRTYNAPERFRNAFIIFLLSKRPLRLTNLSQLVLDKTFFYSTRTMTFEIRFPGHMMKNGDAYSSVFADEECELSDWTRCYIERVLPHFCKGDALFKSRHGGPLRPIGLYQIIADHTENLFGLRLVPHDFRRIFTDSGITNGKRLTDINLACQRRPGSETIYDYKTALSPRPRQVIRPMLDADLSSLLRQKQF